MWNAIANMVIKASDNINRGVENAGKAGEGNNGQDYQISTPSAETGSSGGSGYTPSEQDTSGVESASAGMSKLGSMGKSALSNIGKNDEGGEKDESQTKAGISGGEGITSDERLKNIFGDNEDIIKIFSKIDAIQFTYKDKAHDIPDAENHGVDDDLHFGIKAQDLEKNPLTASAVVEDEQGNKLVDTKELTTINSAVLSEICKRLEIIEKVLGIKVV